MKKLSRRQERELALKYLYSLEIQQKLFTDLRPRQFESMSELPEGFTGETKEAYHLDLVLDISHNLDFIDDVIKEHLVDWRLERLSVVDKNILRIAIYEIIFNPEVPKAVAINEAVEIAKKYGSEDSPGFINGILAQIEEIE